MLRCLIVDDEELARLLLENYLQRLPNVTIVGKCKNPLEAMAVMQQQTVDILLLDIQMPQLSGIDFLKTLRQPPPVVILTTAYPQYALEGYALDVTDYLLKPFDFERFVKAINKAADLIDLRHKAATSPVVEKSTREAITVKSDHKLFRLALADISHIESMREYVAFYTPKGRILSLGSLKSLEEELPADRFIRVHKSFIVAISAVRSLEGNLLTTRDDYKIPVGAMYREAVLGVLF